MRKSDSKGNATYLSFFLSSFAEKVTLTKYFIFFLFTNFTSFREERSVVVMSDSLQGSFILCENKQTEQNSNTPKRYITDFPSPQNLEKKKPHQRGTFKRGNHNICFVLFKRLILKFHNAPAPSLPGSNNFLKVPDHHNSRPIWPPACY